MFLAVFYLLLHLILLSWESRWFKLFASLYISGKLTICISNYIYNKFLDKIKPPTKEA